MARSQNSFIKKKKVEARLKKKKEKFEKKLDKKNLPKSGKLDDMLAYVDKFGNIMSEPPGKEAETDSKDESEANQ